ARPSARASRGGSASAARAPVGPSPNGRVDAAGWAGCTPCMPGVDSSRPFVPLRLAILTVSDTRTLATDTSGGILAARALEAGHHVVVRRVVPDLRDLVEAQLLAWAEQGDVDVTLTTGGTGLTERDITP